MERHSHFVRLHLEFRKTQDILKNNANLFKTLCGRLSLDEFKNEIFYHFKDSCGRLISFPRGDLLIETAHD